MKKRKIIPMGKVQASASTEQKINWSEGSTGEIHGRLSMAFPKAIDRLGDHIGKMRGSKNRKTEAELPFVGKGATELRKFCSIPEVKAVAENIFGVEIEPNGKSATVRLV
jgi:hypothetical protein